MKHPRLASVLLAGAVGLSACAEGPENALGPQKEASLGRQSAPAAINVVLKGPATAEVLADLRRYGQVLDRIDQINAVRILSDAANLPVIQALPYVEAANLDAERGTGPMPTLATDNFANGINTWNLDAVNVTDFDVAGRTLPFDGAGVFIGVLDSGLQDNWREVLPASRIATQYAIAFSGGGMDAGRVTEAGNMWEHDQSGHGTHVTSTILGFDMGTRVVNGVAPRATVIPVKVLNQAGFGWSSIIARGIVYIADLKAGPLAGKPVVINMSLGGARLDAIEKAAVDYAISKGAMIVAAAGNEGSDGMHFPGAYAPVISVAASGWVGEWVGGTSFWRTRDVADPTSASDFYIAEFSSRAKAGQDLDVAAPGSWVVGPFMTNSGQSSFFFLGGTSMASPHVAGIVGLMAQQNASLTAAQAEATLEATSIRLAAGCRTVIAAPGAEPAPVCWGADATGAGLTTADRALGLVRTSAGEGKKK